MSGLFSVFALLGLFRIIIPLRTASSIGGVLFPISLAFLAVEVWMFRVVSQCIELGHAFDRRLAMSLAVLECLNPIVVMFVLMLLHPDEQFLLLVPPGYAFLLVLVSVSVLRVDWWTTAFTGLFAAAGYAGLFGWAFFGGGSGAQSPHPPALYVNLLLMLGVATASAIFVARQVEGYVAAAVREMELRQQRDRLKRDLEIASEIQQALLPRTMPSIAGYDFAALSQPADETGGDYYDWQEITRDRLVFSLADVSGHGVGPALVTAACRAYVRATLGKETDPAAVLGNVNRLLHADLPEGRFVTLVFVDVNASTHDLLLLSAGHGPTLHVRGTDGETTQIGAQGHPLGLFDDAMLDDLVQIHLGAGDLLVLCSDGFFEPSNLAGKAFGVERLIQVIRGHRHESAAAVINVMKEAVRQFIGTAPQPDDMTVVVVKRKA